MKIQTLILLTATAVCAQAATLGTWTASGGANPGTSTYALSLDRSANPAPSATA
jgi:hypothetical protein